MQAEGDLGQARDADGRAVERLRGGFGSRGRPNRLADAALGCPEVSGQGGVSRFRDAWKHSQAALSALVPTAPIERVNSSWSQRPAKARDPY